jgi:3-isopropylmalate/(R)-2-methylmalate dehydratase small subunit
MSALPIVRAMGPAVVLTGDDIDTDRIMPARFLRAITFEGLERHVFEDDRREAAGHGQVHPFDEAARRQARVLVTGRNFGCGSSREHAPQALFRWGICAIVGPSFAEIFFGNAVMIGLPCVTVSESDLDWLRRTVAGDPALAVAVDLESMTVSAAGRSVPASMPDASRQALVSGAWDAIGLLLQDYDAVRQVAARLPYLAKLTTNN